MKACRSAMLSLILSALIVFPTAMKADDSLDTKAPAKKVTTKKSVAKTEASQPSLFSALFGGGDETPTKQSIDTTYKEVKAVKVSSSFGSIVAIARGPKDTVIAIAGPARGVGAVKPSKKGGAEVQIYSKDGELVRKFTVGFAATAAATMPSGELLFAGDGKIARFSAHGKELACIDAPHVANLLKDKSAMKKQAEQRKKSMLQMYEQQVTMLNKQVEASTKSEKDDDGKGTASADRNKSQFESMIKLYKEQIKQINARPLEQYIAEITNQVKTVNSLASAKEFIFLTCGETKGYGYTVWRMNADFSNPKSVLTGLSGCCGQMDVQCCDDCLLVAENSRKRVGVFNFDGKSLRNFGKDGRDSVGEGFGGCCNPMNTFPSTNGSILTSESEGFIKRFDKAGKYVELVAHANLSGGCKNVSVASSMDGKRVYCMDLPGSRFLIFAPKTAANVAAN